MLTVQQMLDIAGKYFTTMANAMIVACVQWANDTGGALVLPERMPRATVCVPDASIAATADLDWERLVRENSDTRWQHV